MTGRKKRKKSAKRNHREKRAGKKTADKKPRTKKRGQKNAGNKTREKSAGKKARGKKAQEKSVGNGAGRKPTDYIVSDLSFTSDWVKKWCEISKPIKMRRGSKGISYDFGYFRRLIEHCFNCD